MCTVTATCSDVIRVRRTLAIGLTVILILISLALIAGAISVVSSTTPDGYQADRIPVAQNSVIPISVRTPPTVDIQIVLSETTVSTSVAAGEPSVVPVSVPTPLLSIGG
jgi:hypothetical protein